MDKIWKPSNPKYPKFIKIAINKQIQNLEYS
jgi:hypothetical protein